VSDSVPRRVRDGLKGGGTSGAPVSRGDQPSGSMANPRDAEGPHLANDPLRLPPTRRPVIDLATEGSPPTGRTGRRARDRLCPTTVAVGGATDGVIVTPSSRGRQRRHRSGAAAPVLAARPIVANTRPILVAGSDRDLAGAVSSVVREFRAEQVSRRPRRRSHTDRRRKRDWRLAWVVRRWRVEGQRRRDRSAPKAVTCEASALQSLLVVCTRPLQLGPLRGINRPLQAPIVTGQTHRCVRILDGLIASGTKRSRRRCR
jgi:hypothetical protein